MITSSPMKPAGTAVVFWTDGERGLAATCKHVIQGSSHGTLTWPGGASVTAAVRGSSSEADLAVLEFAKPTQISNLVIIPLANEPPPVGATVEVCGYGYPSKGLRHFQSRILETGDQLRISGELLDGDSGGAVVYNGELVGIAWGGPKPQRYFIAQEDRRPHHIVDDGYAYTCRPLRSLLQRVFPRACAPMGPQYGQPMLPPVVGPPTLPPVIDPPTLPPVIDPPIPPPPTIAGPQGPPGPQGPAGERGPEGPPGKDVQIDADELAKKIAVLLKQDPQFVNSLKGDIGPPGKDGKDGKEAAPIDIAALLADLQRRFPPTQVEILGDNEQIASVQKVPIGGTIRIPPVVVEKIDGGKRYYQAKPLGEAIRLELVPVPR